MTIDYEARLKANIENRVYDGSQALGLVYTNAMLDLVYEDYKLGKSAGGVVLDFNILKFRTLSGMTDEEVDDLVFKISYTLMLGIPILVMDHEENMDYRYIYDKDSGELQIFLQISLDERDYGQLLKENLQVRRIIREIIDYSDTKENQMRRVFNWLLDKADYAKEFELAETRGIKYRLYDGYNINSASSILFGSGGQCQAYASLLSKMWKAIGVNAWTVLGWVGPNKMGHAWNQVEFQGNIYSVDPTHADNGARDRYMKTKEYFEEIGYVDIGY